MSAKDLCHGLVELEKHRSAYMLAWEQYDGTAREFFAKDHRVNDELGQYSEHFRINVTRKVIKARLNRLKINSISVADASGAVEKLFKDAVYDANELDIELPAWLEKLATYGDSYLLIWPAADANVNEDGTADAVDVFVHSPLTMRAIYSEENTRKIEYVIHAWQRSDGFLRADLYYPRGGDGIERWVSIKEFGDLRGPDGTLSITYEEGMFEELPADDGEGEDADPGGHVDNPYQRVPIFHARTSRPYGRPEHKDAYGPQNALNKLVASHLSAVDWYVWPWRFALSKTGTTGPDLNDWNKDNRQVPARGGAASDRSTERGRMRPGTLNKLHNTDAVGQLDAAPASNFLDPIGAYIRILGEVTDTPMSGIDRTGAAESGESRKAHLDGLLSAVENLQLVARGPLVDAMEFALTVLGEPDQDINLAWKPTQKIDDTEGWLGVKAKEDAGVPIAVALTEAGYLPEEIEAWKGELDGKLDALERIATVATQLGQAVQLMGMPAETATELFGQFITDVITGDDPAAA
jgi:hypothetical protein